MAGAGYDGRFVRRGELLHDARQSPRSSQPEPAPDSREVMREMSTTTTTSSKTEMRGSLNPREDTPPEFR